MDGSSLDFETLAARVGLRVRVGDTISTVPPIDASTTFTAESIEEVHEALSPEPKGFAYARNANPTVVGLEQAMAALENCEDVVAFGSGMSAINSALLGVGLEAGDVIVAASDLYGVSRSLLVHMQTLGVETVFVDVLDPEQVEETIAARRARVLYFESISNPLLRVSDVGALARIGRHHRAIVMIDNTFATPFLFRPLELGVDVVIHSATKYIAGHGDVVAGLVAGNRSYTRRIRDIRTVYGGVLSPFEAWLTLRGIRTLPLRMARQSESAFTIAGWLVEQPWVDRVYYPGLASHDQHAVAQRQFGDRYGGMIAFDLKGTQTETLAFIDALQLITAGTTLGDVESLVLYPPLSSHRNLSRDGLLAAGIGEGLIRLSVGLESPRDLIADLEGAAEASLAKETTAARSAR